MCIAFSSFVAREPTLQGTKLQERHHNYTNGCSNCDRASHLHTLKVTGESFNRWYCLDQRSMAVR